MKLLVDCVPFDRGQSGLSSYMKGLVQALSEAGHELVLIVEPDAAECFSQYDQIRLPRYTAKKSILSILYHMFILPFRLFPVGKSFDLAIICAGNRRVMAFYPMRTVAIVHDLGPCMFKGKYSTLRTWYQRSVVPLFVRSVRFLYASSRSTASDMAKFWKIPLKKIRVNYNGLILRKPGKNDFMSRFHLAEGKYLLYPSRIELPVKNQDGLIRAFSRLSDGLREEYKLVIAGAFWNGEKALHDLCRECGVGNQVIFTGFLPETDLESAYRHAAMLIFPSAYEGFSHSLLEAMHIGLPCACSETSALGELGRGAALLFDPADSSAMTYAMESILCDSDLRERLIAQGKHRAGEFTWARHVRMLTNAVLPRKRK